MSEQTSNSGGGTSVWLIFGLVVSLALNTFFIGAMVGGRASSERWAEWIGRQGGPEPSRDWGQGRHGGSFDPRDLVRVMPDSARDDAIAILEDQGPAIREMLQASGEARFAALEAMRATPFDVEALDTAFAQSRAADEELLGAIHGTMRDMVAGLTPEERAYMVEQLDERVPDFHHRGRHRRDREGRHRSRGDRD